MRAILPARAVDSGALQPSFTVAGVPVATSSALPDWGTVASEPDARLYVYKVVPTWNAGRVAFRLSNEATPMTLRPTTVAPAAARLSAATAVGYCGQLVKAAPMLMLRTSA